MKFFSRLGVLGVAGKIGQIGAIGALGALGLTIGLAGAGCATVEPGYRSAQADHIGAPEQGTSAQDQLTGVPNFYSARSTAAPGTGAFAGVPDTAEPAPIPPSPEIIEVPAAEPAECGKAPPESTPP